MLGRLIRTVKGKCGECETPLQLRGREIIQLIDGEQVSHEEEYMYCPRCENEIEIEDKKRDWRKEYARGQKQLRSEQIARNVSRRGFRGNSRRGS